MIDLPNKDMLVGNPTQGQFKLALGQVYDVVAENQSNITQLQSDVTTLQSDVTTLQSDVVTTATANKILRLDANGKLPASITGDAATVGGKAPGTGANNVLVLDASGKVPTANLPSIPSDNGGVPPGTIIAVAMSAPPSGYLKCNGAAVSRTTYSALFAAIGTTFGAGDGSTTFNLPDLRGEFIRGWDDGRGVDAGRALGSGQADMFKAHEHDLPTLDGIPGTRATVSDDVGAQCQSNPYLASGRYYTYSAGGTETRPRNVALLYCIKY